MLGLPLLPAMMLANSAAAIVQFRAAQLGEGVVAAYGYAARLHGALAQILVIGLSTVLLPHFAALWSRGETAEIVILFRRLARATILMVAYLTTGIVLMGETATKSCFNAVLLTLRRPSKSAGFGPCSACRCFRWRSVPSFPNSARPCAMPAASF